MYLFIQVLRPILLKVYKIITGLAKHSQVAADTIICLWQHVPETPSTEKFQGISLFVIVNNVILSYILINKMCSWNTDATLSTKSKSLSHWCQWSVSNNSPSLVTVSPSKLKYCELLYFSSVSIFVDWAKVTHSWGSKFVVIPFSFKIHTENCFFAGTRFRAFDPPWTLVPHEN